jgi:hypothetical protein
MEGRSVPKLGGWGTAWDVDSGTSNGTALRGLFGGLRLLQGGLPKSDVFETYLSGVKGVRCDCPPETSNVMWTMVTNDKEKAQRCESGTKAHP